MIKVYFPRGCYGTYLAQCIYNYTNLRIEPISKIEFNNNGSSHHFWSKKEQLLSIIRYGHTDDPSLDIHADHVVTILPCQEHRLDYYNNQFFKTEHEQLINYVLTQISKDEAVYKLNTHWEYTGEFDNNVPRWIMREWSSFWINDVLTQSYHLNEYSKIDSTIQLLTQDIFENWTESFAQLALTLDLALTVDADIIKKQHEQFLKLQKFHNIQLRCQQYVADLINGVDSNITLYSIFDEAYIQQLLRQHNIEIRCDGLDVFPSTTHQLRDLTYAR
jgi:hypothetical protein